MGGYRVKSGQSLPEYNANNLPNLPKLGSLNKPGIPAAPKAPEAPIASESTFSLPDEMPTDVGSADDILAAVGGIDGWDSLPEGSAAILSNDGNALFGDDVSALMDDDAGNETKVMNSPFFEQEDNGIDPAVLESAPPTAIISSPKSTPSVQMPPAPPESPSHTAMPAAKAPSNIPSISDLPVSKPKMEAPAAAPAAPIPMAPAAPAASPAPMQQPQAAPMPPAAAKPAPAPAPAPAAPAPAPAVQYATPNAMPTEGREMTDEEQLAAILNSMSPEERAEYEAYSAQQEQQAIEARRAKQRELMEMYGNVGNDQKKGVPVGLIIAIVIILAGFGALIHWIVTAEHTDPAKEAAVKEEAPQAERVFERAAPLNTYSVRINTNGANLLYINGVETPISGNSYEFVSGHRNTVIAFADGMTPFFKTFSNKSQVTEDIDIEMEPASLYLKGSLKFRLTDPSIEGAGLKVTLDGRSLSGLSSPVSDIVLGRPHILTIEKPGFAKHMHIIWPDNKETTITIPELQAPEMALGGTKAYIKLPPASGKPIGIRISTGTQVFNSDIVANVMPGAMIEYQITREQRVPLDVAVIPDGFGTLSLDTTLLRDSIGKSIVSFNRPAGSTLRVCLRRSGELICPNMDAETTVPSGPDWEVFGAEGSDTNLHAIRGGQLQELQSSRKYGFDVSVDVHGTFKLNQASYGKIKKEGEK